jgi:glutathione-regulated potassium-efflux system ancillary protein KefG
MKTLVLLAHPDLSDSHMNRALAEHARTLPDVTVHDLYAAYPDGKIDVTREQALLLAHERIVFQHPIYWYSSPALLKQWQDDVLTYGWAYATPDKQLRGKRFFSAVTLGGNESAYQATGRNKFTIAEMLRPFEMTANMCEMISEPAFVTGGHPTTPEPHEITDEELRAQAEAYARRLTAAL